MKSRETCLEVLRPTVIPLDGSDHLFRVRSGAVYYLVDISRGVCSCSEEGLRGYGNDPHVKQVREYLKLKKRREATWKRS